MQFKIHSFSIPIIRQGDIYSESFNYDYAFTADTRNQFLLIKPDDVIEFSEILLIGLDGKKRKVNDIILNISG